MGRLRKPWGTLNQLVRLTFSCSKNLANRTQENGVCGQRGCELTSESLAIFGLLFSFSLQFCISPVFNFCFQILILIASCIYWPGTRYLAAKLWRWGVEYLVTLSYLSFWPYIVPGCITLLLFYPCMRYWSSLMQFNRDAANFSSKVRRGV